MENSKYKIPLDTVSKFLAGYDEEKYITNIEYDSVKNLVYKIYQHPERGKVIETDTFHPFLWMKPIPREFFYKGNTKKELEAAEKYQIEYIKLHSGEQDFEKYPKTGLNPKLENGYKYLVMSRGGYTDLTNFFRLGGCDIYQSAFKNHFICLNPVEQYLIQKKKRLFKGYEDYNDIHKVIFDIETHGLNPETSRIFLIGVKDNRGYEKLIEISDDDVSERKGIIEFFKVIGDLKADIVGGYNSENFDWYFIFERCRILNLDPIAVSKTLRDDKRIYRRKSILKLGNEIEDYTQTNIWGMSVIDIIHSVRRAQAIDSNLKNARLKYVCKYNKVNKSNRVYVEGDKIGEIWSKNEDYYFNDTNGKYLKDKPNCILSEWYKEEDVTNSNDKTIFLFGDNDLRIGTGGQAKVMRKYQDTKAIGIRTKKKPSMESDAFYIDNEYAENVKKIGEDLMKVYNKILEGYTIVIPSGGIGTGLSKLPETAPKTYQFLRQKLKSLIELAINYKPENGQYIIYRYLMDDLWETLEVDNIYNQTSFLLAKYIPTTYQRVSTMGTATLWKLLMLAWSYENNYTVPQPDNKRPFIGGLSRLIEIGYSERLTKLDYSSLYPSIALAHDIFPDVDHSGVLKSLLKFFHSERFKAKELKSKYKKEGNDQLAALYDRKQLPLKIFINSMYGAFTAPQAFPWAEMDKGEQITCSARQYLRLMLKFFGERGFTPVVLDTDGCNFVKPENIDEFKYIGKGLHKETEKGVEYTGLNAIIAEFNDTYMVGEMGLDVDGEWPSTINIARKNYALRNFDDTISLTGNSIKSKSLPKYLENFINEGVLLLLKNEGGKFIHLYNDTVEKLFNQQIPLVKVASKSRVKMSIDDYKSRGTNINGNPLPKQAHMELAITNNLHIDLGDTIYYVNNGTSKSHGDVGVKKVRDVNDKLIKFKVDDTGAFVKDENGEYIIDKNGQAREDGIYSYLIPNDVIEQNPEKLGEYNVPRMVDSFNKAVERFLVCFNPQIRKDILRNVSNNPEWKKDKTQYRYLLDDAMLFTENEVKLVSGYPDTPTDVDSLIEILTPEEREIEFWERVVGEYNPDFWLNPNWNFSLPNFTPKFESNVIES